jgi:tRNA pseudouridine55 synthase
MNAVVNLHKPADISSHQAVQRVKRLLRVRKAGHAGTLDPMATGVLLVCLNEGTKITRFLADLDKEYTMTVKLGESTDTYDATGTVLRQHPVGVLDEANLQSVLKRFTGRIQQVPPMYSALKKEGTPLYKLARKGISIERAERPVTIHSLSLLRLRLPFLELKVTCSKGTYMRTLCEDIGNVLGVGAHMVSLTRTRIGRFRIEDAVLPEELGTKGQAVHSMESALSHLPGVVLTHHAFVKAGHGMSPSVRDIVDSTDNAGGGLFPPEEKEQFVRLLGPGAKLFGVGKCSREREDIKIERLFHTF